MRDVYLSYDLSDNGGRRIGIERRGFSYAEHIPERRSGEDRRQGTDRRRGIDRRNAVERRCAIDRRTKTEADRPGTTERRVVENRRRGIAL